MTDRKKTLIIQGGGFRTGFSTGVLDAFQAEKYNDFDLYIGVSGGAIAMSYFLSEQHMICFDAMCMLIEDKKFISYSSLMSRKGMMNIDYLYEVTGALFPFDIQKAHLNSINRELAIVMTDRHSGEPHYYHPSKNTWIDAIIASCTLPLVTKGRHSLNGVDYFDGGWSDPLPAEWAYNGGAKDITLIRTTPKEMKFNQSWTDYLASLYHWNYPKMKNIFEENHTRYNEAIDFISNPPFDLKITQIAPESPLKAGTYSNSITAIKADYEYGRQCGVEFLSTLK